MLICLWFWYMSIIFFFFKQKTEDEWRISDWSSDVCSSDLVDIDESMIRAFARQAEAERERRAKVINAEGEQQAAQKLLEAGEILARRPEAMQLRYLSTLNVIAGEKSSTVLFPFPMEFGPLLRTSVPSEQP